MGKFGDAIEMVKCTDVSAAKFIATLLVVLFLYLSFVLVENGMNY